MLRRAYTQPERQRLMVAGIEYVINIVVVADHSTAHRSYPMECGCDLLLQQENPTVCHQLSATLQDSLDTAATEQRAILCQQILPPLV